jgi:large subunit ribosomal protein L21e
MQRKGGNRRKTRSIMRKNIRERGKISLTKYFQELEEGQQVLLKAEPAIQNGMYFRRFHGNVGKVVGKRGRCYEVAIKDQNKDKTVIVHPVHLRKC